MFFSGDLMNTHRRMAQWVSIHVNILLHSLFVCEFRETRFNMYVISAYIFTAVEAEKIKFKEGVNMLHTSYTKVRPKF